MALCSGSGAHVTVVGAGCQNQPHLGSPPLPPWSTCRPGTPTRAADVLTQLSTFCFCHVDCEDQMFSVVQHLPGSRRAHHWFLLGPLVLIRHSCSLPVCVSSAEFSVVLKVDNRIVGRTHWRQLGTEPWDQSFSTELERVSTISWSGWFICSNSSWVRGSRADTPPTPTWSWSRSCFYGPLSHENTPVHTPHQ